MFPVWESILALKEQAFKKGFDTGRAEALGLISEQDVGVERETVIRVPTTQMRISYDKLSD